jgi:ankyrin repeat protein
LLLLLLFLLLLLLLLLSFCLFLGRHFDVIKFLIKMGSEINRPSGFYLFVEPYSFIHIQDNFGYTPLILSINHLCDSETVQFLLDHGADPLSHSQQSMNENFTLLFCFRQILLFEGCHFNCANSLETYPLHFACKCGSIAIVEKLLNQPILTTHTATNTTIGHPTATIDINQKDLHGWTPLHYGTMKVLILFVFVF